MRILEPLTVGPVTVGNRVVSAAHVTGLADPGIGDDFIAYHEARAAGGVGLVILEFGFVHESSPRGLDLTDDGIVDGYRRLMDRLARYQTRVFQQLNHAGRFALPRSGGPPWGMSAVPGVDLDPAGVEVPPVEMTGAQIRLLTRAFAAAAARVRAGGLHGVEVHLGHGMLLDQSLSPLANQRTDSYGGSFDKRLRFARETLAAVRDAAGPGLAVGARISAEETAPGGRSQQATVAIVRALEADGLLDFLDVSVGQRDAHETIGPMHREHGYQLPKSGPVARAVNVPAIVTGRITSLAEAERVVATGDAQMVSMVRAHIADPQVVLKTREGRAAEVRPCIGCNHGCIAGVRSAAHRLGCAVNPRAGRELRLSDETLERAPRARRVAVVGGGPAGLEAARVARIRGHEVSLFEAQDELGGQLAVARLAPLRSDIGAIVDWLTAELDRLEVDTRTGVRASAGTLGSKVDAVIVATGAQPRRDGFRITRPHKPIEGIDSGRVLTSCDFLRRPEVAGDVIAVVDDVGHYEAVAVTDAALKRGAHVHFATRFSTIGPLLDASLTSEPARSRFADQGVQVYTEVQCESVRGRRIRFSSVRTDAEHELEVDALVVVAGSLPDRRLADELARAGREVHIVGDARGPRFLLAAVHEGHMAGRAV